MKMVKCYACLKGPCYAMKKGMLIQACDEYTVIAKQVDMIELPKQSFYPRLEDLKIGYEVEIKFNESKTWRPYLFLMIHDGWLVFRSINDKIFYHREIGSFKIRMPPKKIIRRGQPIILGSGECLSFFDHFDMEGGVVCNVSLKSTSAHSIWRLPTNGELKQIGQDDLGWLTSD